MSGQTTQSKTQGMNDWTPVYLDDFLKAGAVVRSFVGDHDIALWRSFSGKVHAWLNRCPHRGMRLSYGFVRGEMLACIYHGWHYGEDTVCRYIPAHPELTPPDTIQATAFNCVQKGGLIWVGKEDANKAALNGPEGHGVRSLVINAPLQNVRSALGMDDAISSKVNVEKIPSILALQALSDNKTNLHILSQEPMEPEQKKVLSRWAEQARREIELEQGTT
ncbi:MAG: Rieske 2Fe-2S domain-containing protein [Hyphomicrobiales bacterium]